MTISPSNVAFGTNFKAGQALSAAETKRIVIKEIRAKWGKFSDDDYPRSRTRMISLLNAPRSTVWKNRWRSATSTPS
jgi:hypothetical protein